MLRAGIDCGGFPTGLLPEEVPRSVPAPYESVPVISYHSAWTIAYHKKGLIAYSVGFVLAAGIIGFVLYKKKKKKIINTASFFIYPTR